MPETRRSPVSALIAAVPVGAAALIVLTSVLLAATGGGELWVSSPLPFDGIWHGFVALAVAASILPVRRLPARVRAAARFSIGLLLVLAVCDIAGYYSLVTRGAIRTSLPLPLSIAVAGILLWSLLRLRGGEAEPRHPGALLPRLAGAASGAILLLLGLLITFGSTDYRRKADCAIVLGAGVWNDGSPSLALSDRVNEGIRLWREGLVDRLLMTGGIGRNGWSEPEVMKRIAVEAGVPEEMVLLDETGYDTRRSAEGCRRIMDEEGLSTALVVSHYYHLARCRMAFELSGIRCTTVPATMSRRLAKEPYYVLRECAGFLAYLFPREVPAKHSQAGPTRRSALRRP